MFSRPIAHHAGLRGGAIRTASLVLFAIASLWWCLGAAVWAQTFQAGEAIEYKVRNTPPQWERGVFVRPLPNGTQLLIRQKPSTYFPEGSERAFDIADVRRPGSEPPRTAALAQANAGAAAPAAKSAPPRSAHKISGAGLLSKEDVVAYAQARIGADPWKNPPRDANLANIRDHIRARGTNFGADTDFGARMDAISANSVHISYAVNANRGAHPALADYTGVWLLRAASRGSKSTKRDSSGRLMTTTTDSQAESGQLTINPDGSYVWRLFRADPEAKWLRGRWREVQPDELNLWEGGPALWLLQAKQGHDYMVRMGRDPDWPGWIDVGAGKARTPVEYGRRP